MPVEYICDWCGERQQGGKNYRNEWIKPHKWYSRIDSEKGELLACSRECVRELGGLIAPW